jgi:glutaredoxin 3
MPQVVMYCTAHCPYCIRAEQLLGQKGVVVEKIRVDHFSEQTKIMVERTGRRTVPQIFIGERHVGGFDDLAALEQAGELEPLLVEN